MTAVILANSVLCAAGSGSEQVWASVRAGISRITQSRVMGRNLEAIRMGLVPDDALEPELPPEVQAVPLPSRARRMLRLAAPALRAVLADAGAPPVRLYLGLPQLSAAEAPWIKGFALYLGKTAGVVLDAPNSRVVPSGRAAALMALELALEALRSDPSRPVIVGAVDTFLDLQLLASLETEGRLLLSGVMDGFIPGEGAAFLVLADPAAARADAADGAGAGASARAGDTGGAGAGASARAVTVQAAASVADAGHRYGAEPARGEGLARAIDALRVRLEHAESVGTTFAGLNGESFDAKAWGVARVRHPDFFGPRMVLEHPADCFGDAGAALGAILLCLAATALGARHRPGPALVWAASDGESRACALMSASKEHGG